MGPAVAWPLAAYLRGPRARPGHRLLHRGRDLSSGPRAGRATVVPAMADPDAGRVHLDTGPARALAREWVASSGLVELGARRNRDISARLLRRIVLRAASPRWYRHAICRLAIPTGVDRRATTSRPPRRSVCRRPPACLPLVLLRRGRRYQLGNHDRAGRPALPTIGPPDRHIHRPDGRGGQATSGGWWTGPVAVAVALFGSTAGPHGWTLGSVFDTQTLPALWASPTNLFGLALFAATILVFIDLLRADRRRDAGIGCSPSCSYSGSRGPKRACCRS